MLSDRLIATTKTLIDSYGTKVDIIKRIEGSYNPSAGQNHVIEELIPTKANISTYQSSDVVEGVINFGDSRAIVYLDEEPTVNWAMRIGDDIYEFINVRAIGTQGKNIFYEIQMRK